MLEQIPGLYPYVSSWTEQPNRYSFEDHLARQEVSVTEGNLFLTDSQDTPAYNYLGNQGLLT